MVVVAAGAAGAWVVGVHDGCCDQTDWVQGVAGSLQTGGCWVQAGVDHAGTEGETAHWRACKEVAGVTVLVLAGFTVTIDVTRTRTVDAPIDAVVPVMVDTIESTRRTRRTS